MGSGVVSIGETHRNTSFGATLAALIVPLVHLVQDDAVVALFKRTGEVTTQ